MPTGRVIAGQAVQLIGLPHLGGHPRPTDDVAPVPLAPGQAAAHRDEGRRQQGDDPHLHQFRFRLRNESHRSPPYSIGKVARVGEVGGRVCETRVWASPDTGLADATRATRPNATLPVGIGSVPRGTRFGPMGIVLIPLGFDSAPLGFDPVPWGNKFITTGTAAKRKGIVSKPRGTNLKPRGIKSKPKGNNLFPRGTKAVFNGVDPFARPIMRRAGLIFRVVGPTTRRWRCRGVELVRHTRPD